jgi:hypothetical protein
VQANRSFRAPPLPPRTESGAYSARWGERIALRRAATVVLAAVALVGLAACSSSGDTGAAWYQSGDANYDALKAATDACKAKGGQFQLKDGGDPTHLTDYECKGAKGG